MSELSSDQLAQRIYESHLMEMKEIEQVMAKAGGRGRASLDEFIVQLLQNENLTNWQIARLMEGHRKGYFYGKWQVLYLVGAGTFARVYRGSHRRTGDVKAVKVLRSRYSADQETRDRFTNEAKMVMQLRHPNIVPIHEVDQERGRSFMVMDFVEGQNLRDYVRAHQGLKITTALSILRDLAAGLSYAAERGITHRDMKLSNVLLSSKGQAKLVDFGLATVNKDFDDDGPTFNPRSIDYAGLEKVTNVARNDSRSDIYFLGCMLYHMVTGVPPLFETRERIKRLSARRYREIVPLTVQTPNLPHRLVVLCNRLMELNPERRVQTPALVLREVESCLEAIQTGKAESYDPELSKQEAEEYEQQMREREEGQGYTILIIESNLQVQDMLRSKLKNLGYRVLIMGNPDRALERFEGLDPAEERPAHCVIFGCAGLGVNGVKAFVDFSQARNTRTIPAMLLLKAQQKQFMSKIKLRENHRQLDLPIKFKNVRLALKALLDAEKDLSVN